MLKKTYTIIIIFSIIFYNTNFVFADNIEKNGLELENINIKNIIETCSNCNEKELIIESKIGVAYDRASGKIIWGKDESKRSAMASTTKIMTLIVAIENSNLDEEVKISNKASWTGGSSLNLKTGDIIKLEDLLYGLMLKSGNDAAVAIAEHIGGSVEKFVEMMNIKTIELGLKDTYFVTPHGLDDPEHYTTATELAIITDYALRKRKNCKYSIYSKTYN